jgi:hypothetical protein
MSNTITHNIQSSTTTIHKRPSIIGSFRYEFYGDKRMEIFLFLFRYILKYEGIKGLFKGLIPNLVGVAPSRYELK